MPNAIPISTTIEKQLLERCDALNIKRSEALALGVRWMITRRETGSFKTPEQVINALQEKLLEYTTAMQLKERGHRNLLAQYHHVQEQLKKLTEVSG